MHLALVLLLNAADFPTSHFPEKLICRPGWPNLGRQQRPAGSKSETSAEAGLPNSPSSPGALYGLCIPWPNFWPNYRSIFYLNFFFLYLYVKLNLKHSECHQLGAGGTGASLYCCRFVSWDTNTVLICFLALTGNACGWVTWLLTLVFTCVHTD